MSEKHFNSTLSPITKNRSIAVVKWTFRARVKVTMSNGGQRWGSADAIIIRRSDVEKVHDYARQNRDLRDYLLIRLPMKIGLRTREIATLAVEDIDFETRSFQVLDSKKHTFYPLPLDVLTLQLIQDLVKDVVQGLVFKHKTYKHERENKPLTNVSIWKTVRDIGEEVNVKGFHPRVLRHYFAAEWHIVQHKSIETLRRILRHKNLSVTHRYLSRLVFFEDIQKEYEETKNPYISIATRNLPDSGKGSFYEEFCSKCDHEPTCKFLEKMCSCEACSGCRFYKPKKEETQKIG